MKKVLSFIALAAMVCFVACQKADNKKSGNNKENQGGNDEPEEVYEAPITIDGDYADWAKLDASKVATATCPSGAKYEALKTLKVYADEYYMFMYIDFTPQAADAAVSLGVFLNADNSDETGGYADLWNQPNSEWYFEGPVTDWDASLFKWWGGVGENGWIWSDPSTKHDDSDAWGAFVAAAGFCASSGDLAAGKAEFSIALESLAETFTLSSTFDLGVTLAISWATAGVLPCGAISDDDPNGIAPKLKVTVVK